MEVKDGSKQTEVGVIPEDWILEPLKQLSAFITKGATPTTYGFRWESQGVLFLRSECVSENGLDLTQSMYISPEAHNSLRRSQVTDGDLLITITGNVGRVVFLSGIGTANLNQHIARIRITASHVDARFVYHFLSQISVRKRFESITTGQAYPQISLKQVRDAQVPLPPTKAEQEAIAEALGDADALIESLERLVAKKRQLKQGAMQELLTGKRRLPGFSGEWEERAILDLGGRSKELFDDGDWIESEHITDEGIRLIQTGNIGVGRFIERDAKKYIFESSFVALRCKEIRQGDLLICRLADPAGRSCVLPDIGETKIITSVDVTIFRPPAALANRVFLVNVFSTDQWFRAVSDRSGGTTHKRISRGALGRLRVRIPSVEEQTAIAEILIDMDAEIAAFEAKLAKARQLKQGMMQELLTGRIRLV